MDDLLLSRNNNSTTTTTSRPCYGYACYYPSSSNNAEGRVGGNGWNLNTAKLGGILILTAIVWFVIGQLFIRWKYKQQIAKEKEEAEKGLRERKKFVKEKLIVERWTKGMEINNGTEENDNTCSICMEEYKIGDKISTSLSSSNNNKSNKLCKHIFHTDCIKEWLWSNSECPMCRTIFLGSEESKNFLLQRNNNHQNNMIHNTNEQQDEQGVITTSSSLPQSQRRLSNNDNNRITNVVIVASRTSATTRNNSSNRLSSISNVNISPQQQRQQKIISKRSSRGTNTNTRVVNDPLDEISDDENNDELPV